MTILPRLSAFAARLMALSLLLSVTAFVVSCGGDDSSTPEPDPIPQPEPEPDVEPEASIITDESDYQMSYVVAESLVQKAVLDVAIESGYSHISVLDGDRVLLDSVNIPAAGQHQLVALVEFASAGEKTLTFKVRGEPVTLNSIEFQEVPLESFPVFSDISAQVGLDTENTLKYGGPSVADLNNDGHYDMVLNNHNVIPAQVFWNNGDATLTEQEQPLFSWPPDLHGSAAGDYDNDGDLDLLLSKGGGNGTNPAPPFLMRNDDGVFTQVEGTSGITKGARGRSPRWIDMDLDGDLDLALINAAGINGESGEQHIFYRNVNGSTFEPVRVPGIETAPAERMLVLDFDRDGIDDILLFSPVSLWRGNGDFGFTNVTNTWLPESVQGLHQVHASADVDLDNDGNYDLYLARGKPYFQMSNKSVDYDPDRKQLDINDEGNEGRTEFTFTAPDAIQMQELDLTYRGYDGGFPIFLGENKTAHDIDFESQLNISPAEAEGWPEERTANGIYIGHIGNGEWRVETVRNQDVYWKVDFTLTGVSSVETPWEPNNRNVQDVLLLNKGDRFVEADETWGIPKGGNHWGVTHGDFNNDGFNDLYLYRFGFMKHPVADYLLVNNGGSGFNITTMHNAFDPQDGGHSDMGQAFDFNLDGGVDLLNGSDEYGKWYLYQNSKQNSGNYFLVQVGYSPLSGIDPISAEVVVKTASGTYIKRVGSAGEVHSQSLINTVHFGLGDAETVESVSIRWRNGEVIGGANIAANTLFRTDEAELPEPESITIDPTTVDLREGRTQPLTLQVSPPNADPAVSWQSSDDSIASVDEQGVVTGHQAGSSVTITATSTRNQQQSEASVNVVDDFDVPVEGVSVTPESALVFVGTTAELSAQVSPANADDKNVQWESSDSAVAAVDNNGIVTGVANGVASVSATTNDGGFSDSAAISVETFADPSIEFVDLDYYTDSTFFTNESLNVSASYHAGSGHTVVDSSIGGVQFMLRHLNASWGVEQDVVAVFSSAVDTVSGTATAMIPLEGLTPTADLPEGDFYYLFARFTSSEGSTPNQGVWPINIEYSP
ncbi:Ig-like domain-containing protein [Gilvimarinus japonicus]|uniref:Ig-like domain-containing protein n=1 Tax=Gilvimarinus japonicus TaxID=1796469 RepID=A0ABV7HUZ1_9GAMM